MIRRSNVGLLFTVLLLTVFPVEAQQPERNSSRSAILQRFRCCGYARRNAFRQGLRDLGYMEGQNIVIEYRVGEGP